MILSRSWQPKRVVWTKELIGFAKPDEDSLTDAIPLAEVIRIHDSTEPMDEAR
jgi:hypothetical protein